MSDSDNCEMCGANNWTHLKGNEWKRCICGYLEIALSQRLCSICGKTLGKYTKKSTTICLTCRGYGGEHCCKTIFCCNQLNKHSRNGLCQECLSEMELIPNGHLWKELASYIFQTPTKLEAALTQLQVEYPHVQKSQLHNWIKKHWHCGRMKKTARGIYQVKEDNDKDTMD